MKSSDVVKQIKKINKNISKSKAKIDELLASCEHDDAIVQREFYSEGSYYDKAYTQTWSECSVCKKMLTDPSIETHSWYG